MHFHDYELDRRYNHLRVHGEERNVWRNSEIADLMSDVENDVSGSTPYWFASGLLLGVLVGAFLLVIKFELGGM